MRRRFPELRLCEANWKVDQIATDIYPSWHHHYFKGMHTAIKQEAEVADIGETRPVKKLKVASTNEPGPTLGGKVMGCDPTNHNDQPQVDKGKQKASFKVRFIIFWSISNLSVLDPKPTGWHHCTACIPQPICAHIFHWYIRPCLKHGC